MYIYPSIHLSIYLSLSIYIYIHGIHGRVQPRTRWCLLELPPDQLKTLEAAVGFATALRDLRGASSTVTYELYNIL